MTTTRAASRLKRKPVSPRKSESDQKQTRQPVAAAQRKKTTLQNSLVIKLGKQYLAHLPTLLIGLGFSFLSYKILTYIHPDSIKHVLLPNSYLPLLLTIFFALFFLASYLLLNSRRGFFISYFAVIILFLTLQQVELSAVIVLLVTAPFFMLDLLITAITFIKSKK